jgi:gluconokinase
VNFLRVNYDDLRERVPEGGSDEEILEWCFENGRRLNEDDLLVWNEFMSKFGWKDFRTPALRRMKEELGIPDRDDIETIGDLMDFEEKRKS